MIIRMEHDNTCHSGISQPMIISELSHTAEHIAGLENETVVDIKSGDFISSVLTKSGMCVTKSGMCVTIFVFISNFLV